MGAQAGVPESEEKANNHNNISNQGFSSTCYAHAAAHAIRETESRIVGREIPNHQRLVQKFVRDYGTKTGGTVAKIFRNECKPRGLRYTEVYRASSAREAVEKGRVVVGLFWLNEGQWDKICAFFSAEKTRGWVYERSDIGAGFHGEDDGAHAVAICGIGETAKGTKYWKIKNSWGAKWGDGGYFRVSLDWYFYAYYDIYFLESDLTQLDRNNYNAMELYTTLKARGDPKALIKMMAWGRTVHPKPTWHPFGPNYEVDGCIVM